MQRTLRLVAAVALAAWPIVLLAQQPPEAPPAPRAPRAPRAARAPRAFAFAFDDNRGRVGVIVRTDANEDSDKLGAKIEAVTPGGPAAKAGLKVGDIITKFNGTALAGVPSDDEEESGPGKKLIALARKLEPGDTVQVEFRRGTEVKKATLVAEDLGASRFLDASRFRVRVPEPGMMVMPPMPAMPDMHFDFFESPWGDLRFVSLNPDLGEYFGTKEGVLVVKAPVDSSLPLKSGDVILSIGGRKPASPEHAMRILRSYDKGETVSIEIMRKQKRLTVAWKVPSREDRSLRREEREEQSGWWRQPLRHRSHLQRA
jgi:S1-C subfamily serine protease